MNELLGALALFAFVSSITPGPNNLMLMSSGATFGWQKTLPHLFGVALGFTFMVMMVGVGVMQLFSLWPFSYVILKYLSIAYLLFLAFKIANSSTTSDTKQKNKPMTFLQAVMFQWVNPKAWTMALTAISVYAPDKALLSVAYVAIVFGLVNLPSISMWALMGQKLQPVLKKPKTLLMFNRIMALLLVSSLYPVVFN